LLRGGRGSCRPRPCRSSSVRRIRDHRQCWRSASSRGGIGLASASAGAKSSSSSSSSSGGGGWSVPLPSFRGSSPTAPAFEATTACAGPAAPPARPAQVRGLPARRTVPRQGPAPLEAASRGDARSFLFFEETRLLLVGAATRCGDSGDRRRSGRTRDPRRTRRLHRHGCSKGGGRERQGCRHSSSVGSFGRRSRRFFFPNP
jgi:hypothetical protein